MRPFQAGLYSDIYRTRLGKEIVRFVEQRRYRVIMRTNTLSGRPALRGVGRFLLSKFGAFAMQHRVKQMIGERVGQLMDEAGFRRVVTTRVQGDPVFRRAKLYA